MSENREGLLSQAHKKRVGAERARRLAAQIANQETFNTLMRYAAELELHAQALEKQANVPPPVVAIHQNPVQMQQAQILHADEEPRLDGDAA